MCTGEVHIGGGHVLPQEKAHSCHRRKTTDKVVDRLGDSWHRGIVNGEVDQYVFLLVKGSNSSVVTTS